MAKLSFKTTQVEPVSFALIILHFYDRPSVMISFVPCLCLWFKLWHSRLSFIVKCIHGRWVVKSYLDWKNPFRFVLLIGNLIWNKMKVERVICWLGICITAKIWNIGFEGEVDLSQRSAKLLREINRMQIDFWEKKYHVTRSNALHCRNV